VILPVAEVPPVTPLTFHVTAGMPVVPDNVAVNVRLLPIGTESEEGVIVSVAAASAGAAHASAHSTIAARSPFQTMAFSPVRKAPRARAPFLCRARVAL
jgi:hypothetical protein